MKLLKRFISIISWPFLFIGANLFMWGVFFLSLLPHKRVKAGERFMVLEDIKTTALTHWQAPATFGFKCTIPEGTVLVSVWESAIISRGFACIPENEKEFEQRFVPFDDRNHPKYAGYSFVLRYSEIGKRLRQLNPDG